MEAPSAGLAEAIRASSSLTPISLRTEVVDRLDDDRAWKPDDGGGHEQGGGDFEEAGQFNNKPIAPGMGASVPDS
jgi:hypothetical protein